MSAEQLMDKLVNAISYKYKDDKTVPGLTIARLKKGYYCSVVRYCGPFARDKEVVCNARGDDLTSALKKLATTFVQMSAVTKTPLQELGDLVL